MQAKARQSLKNINLTFTSVSFCSGIRNGPAFFWFALLGNANFRTDESHPDRIVIDDAR